MVSGALMLLIFSFGIMAMVPYIGGLYMKREGTIFVKIVGNDKVVRSRNFKTRHKADEWIRYWQKNRDAFVLMDRQF